MSSRGVNKVIIVGNLGATPEARYTSGGTAVTNFNVATSDRWKDKGSGEMQERTEWHRVVTFARKAEVAAQYLSKGSKVYIEGRLQTRKWQDSDGSDRYITEIVANEMQMLGGGEGTPATRQDQRSAPSNKPRQATAKSYGDAKDGRKPAPAYGIDDDLDDDIPF